MGEKVNKQRLQGILGKDHKTILKWQKEGMPIERVAKRGQSNTYDTEKVIDWLVGRASSKDQLDQARIRLTTAQAVKAELEAEEYLGNLISLEKMKETWANVLSTFRARILSMPSRLTPLITVQKEPKKVERIIKDSCVEALNELANYDLDSHHKGKGRRAGGAKGSSTTTTA